MLHFKPLEEACRGRFSFTGSSTIKFGCATALALAVAANPASAGVIEFFEGNHQKGDLVLTMPDHRRDDLKLTNSNRWGGENDEIRSIRLKWVTPGTLITLYDSPDASTRQDWVRILVKDWHEAIDIVGLESNRSNQFVQTVYIKQDGNLDGKVSRITVTPARPEEPPLVARIHQCLQRDMNFAYRHKDGTAHEWRSQGSDYRADYPTISPSGDGFTLRLTMDHIRGFSKDDYSVIVMNFDEDRNLTSFNAETKIDDTKLNTAVSDAAAQLPDAARTNKYGVIAESAALLASKIYDFVQDMGESGGRLHFAHVIEETVAKTGRVIADCEASRFEKRPPPPRESGGEDVVSDQPQTISAEPGQGRYAYALTFKEPFTSDLNVTVNGRILICKRNTNSCRWRSDDSTPSLAGCRRMRLATGRKTILSYGYPGKMLNSRDIARCNLNLPF